MSSLLNPAQSCQALTPAHVRPQHADGAERLAVAPRQQSDEYFGFQSIAVFFRKREMVLRRRAEPRDKCEGFERLAARHQGLCGEHGRVLGEDLDRSSSASRLLKKPPDKPLRI
jgi:hypothetical protein